MERDRRLAVSHRLFRTVCVAIALAAGSDSAAAGGLIGARAAHASAQSTEAHVSDADVTAVHVHNNPEAAQLSFDLTQAVTPTAFVLADPDRVIVDLPQVGFGVDPGVGKLGSGRGRHGSRGLIGSFRFGLMAPGRSRIVIDLAEPARIAVAAVKVSNGRPKLEIELAKTDRASFRASARDLGQGAKTAVASPSPVPLPGKATIVIDAGHGGPDTGAMVNGVVEKDVTLAFAKMLAGKLDASGHFNVVLTRSTDVFIPLRERAGLARRSAAALMVSVHADTLPESTDVSGATVYTVSDKASDAYAAKVAAKENEADSAVGIDGQADTADVNDILFDLTRRETRAYSHVFARTLVNYWKVAGRLNKPPQRAAGFVVLKAPDVPSVLLELGYLSSPLDAASLTSDAWRNQAAGRMAEAIETYFADHHGPAKAAAGVTIPLQADATPAAAR